MDSMRVGRSVELALDILGCGSQKYVVFVEIRGIGRAEASFLEPLISSASEPLREPLFWLDDCLFLPDTSLNVDEVLGTSGSISVFCEGPPSRYNDFRKHLENSNVRVLHLTYHCSISNWEKRNEKSKFTVINEQRIKNKTQSASKHSSKCPPAFQAT
jgi:hypothetical protein